MRTVKATMDEHGHVEVLEPITLDAKREVLITILAEDTHPQTSPLSSSDDATSTPQRNPEKDTEERNEAKRFLSGCLIILAVGFSLYMIFTALMFRAFTP